MSCIEKLYLTKENTCVSYCGSGKFGDVSDKSCK